MIRFHAPLAFVRLENPSRNSSPPIRAATFLRRQNPSPVAAPHGSPRCNHPRRSSAVRFCPPKARFGIRPPGFPRAISAARSPPRKSKNIFRESSRAIPRAEIQRTTPAGRAPSALGAPRCGAPRSSPTLAACAARGLLRRALPPATRLSGPNDPQRLVIK